MQCNCSQHPFIRQWVLTLYQWHIKILVLCMPGVFGYTLNSLGWQNSKYRGPQEIWQHQQWGVTLQNTVTMDWSRRSHAWFAIAKDPALHWNKRRWLIQTLQRPNEEDPENLQYQHQWLRNTSTRSIKLALNFSQWGQFHGEHPSCWRNKKTMGA